MNLNEFYEAVGGKYDEVLGRLAKEERILKYLNKYVDNPDYEDLVSALNAEDYEAAFRHSHNLKGVAANLGLGNLFEASHAICEELRPCVKPDKDISGMLEAVKLANEAVKASIAKL